MNRKPTRIARTILLTALLAAASLTTLPPASADEDDRIVRCQALFILGEPLHGVWREVVDRFEPVREIVFDNTGDDVNLGRGPCTPFDQANFVGEGVAGMQPDTDDDGMGDPWEAAYGAYNPNSDLDGDGLSNLGEFQWASHPLDADTDNDNWLDGPESQYWKTYQSGGILVPSTPMTDGMTMAGTGARLDTDGDLLTNMWDRDSDNDGLLDGTEATVHATRPELSDTDGDGLVDGGIALGRTVAGEVLDYGTLPKVVDSDNDMLEDKAEVEYWKREYPSSNLLTLDSDGDGTRNMRDPDSDNDALTDGVEASRHGTKAGKWDTDLDAMPDGWETQHNLNPLVADASLDVDADELSNLLEYRYERPAAWNELAQGPYWLGTNPDDADTEGDLLLDGQEVLDYGSDPLFWDTDLDGMADWFETTWGFDPANPSDGGGDPDGDAFDQGNDGTIEQAWTNTHEYQYQRPTVWSEEDSGPWQAGTEPLNPDTDGDSAPDGMEAYFATNARVPADLASDDDADGLTWTEEVEQDTNPSDADTDGDGLCDGGRGTACRFPGLGTAPGQPGERDYGSIPWDTDSDGDGLLDGAEAKTWDPGASGSAQDVDGDLLNGVMDADSDNDGLTDGDEFNVRNTDMKLFDTDSDRLNDGSEVNHYLTNPKIRNTDLDGLDDGDEVEVYHTLPLVADTDGDGLNDGAEIKSYGTDPLLSDSDQDNVPDGWEVSRNTQPRTPDGDQDPDGDGLNNAFEYGIATYPMNPDSDEDLMPDGYEHRHGLNPLLYDPTSDLDSDGLANLGEFTGQTNPAVPDTDGDGRMDGWEVNTGKTDPLRVDSDLDGMDDGPEYENWTLRGYSWTGNPDSDQRNGLNDDDSDGDGLNDRDEFLVTNTKPHVKDTDADGLTDAQEVIAYGGKYDPNKADTDGDGTSDGTEVALADSNGDFDEDGLKNGDETTYGTDATAPDSDCDGIMDGPERNYWGTAWNTGGNRLLTADVDGDSIKDGVEVGTVGTPSQTMYRTRPDRADSDGDGLNDGDEASNNVRVACDEPIMTGTSSASSPAAPGAAPQLSAAPPVTLTGDNGLSYVLNTAGGFITGGFGVRLIPDGVTLDDLLTTSRTNSGPAVGINGERTDPSLPDTDGDGLTDGEEVTGSRNPYSNAPTDATDCDSDDDGLGDGLELGVTGGGSISVLTGEPACQQRDTHGASRTNPKKLDTDGDLIQDGSRGDVVGEDANNNGWTDVLNDGYGYCGIGGTESDPADVDSDDDGLSETQELEGTFSIQPTSIFCFDSDGDGLSDGLEVGRTSTQATAQTNSRTVYVAGYGIPTWQPSATGAQLNPNNPDMDSDGVLDGLEDLDHDGRFGLTDGEMNPTAPDTDGDGVLDGRELLLYGMTGFANPIAEALTRWGGSTANSLFSSANPWETNPLVADTDADGAKDGIDYNPRADAAVSISFDAFQMLERPDCCQNDGWYVDLYFNKITVELPILNSKYVIGLDEGTAVTMYSKDRRTLDQAIFGPMEDETNIDDKPPGIPSTMWKVEAIASEGVLRLNIPDASTSADIGDLCATVKIQAKDWDPGSANDVVDLNAIDQVELQHDYCLDEDLQGGLASPGNTPDDAYRMFQAVSKDHAGKKQGGDGNKDGLLGIRVGDEVPTFFLEALKNVHATGKSGLPPGNCFGTAQCVG